MANFTQAGPGTGARSRPNIATMTNWAGAAVSLALIAGVGVWGARLIMRDVSGVPVVQASEGPMRVAPENPGGEAADHQGLSVNDVAGTGIAADPADRLTLAPRPVALSDEDIALGITDVARPDALPDSLSQVRYGPDATADTTADTTAEAEPPKAVMPAPTSSDPIQALADQIAAGVAPLSGSAVAAIPEVERMPEEDDSDTAVLEEDTSTEAATETPVADLLVDAIPRTIAGVARSLRPQLRPTGLERTASLAPLVPVAAATPELDAETLPTGTRLVQLGAYDSAETARAEWTRLETRFGDYMEGKDRVIQRASSGGRVFYRLRAHGFADISDARRFCSAFVSENADCIPVVTR
ncbi:SPOR domain-containing protein [Puniceibacterium confluentis]|uniref:SPOR domain-containing protein n=1 Tax=Puniceibacterium confluentis TaxID=1958944 RepID=UPI00356B26F0